MLNATVGVGRVIGRLRRPQEPRSITATVLQDRSLPLARRLREGLSTTVVASDELISRMVSGSARSVGWSSRRPVVDRLGPDRAVVFAVVGILLGASVVSLSAGAPGAAGGSGLAGARARAATGGTTGAGVGPRIAIGGGAYLDPVGDVVLGQPAFAPAPAFTGSAVEVGVAADGSGGQSDTVGVEGPFLDDGTLLKPVAVNTTVADGRDLVRMYAVKNGDSLESIARQFGVSAETVWWANDLKSKDQVKPGKILRIPPVNGLIVTVAAGDTLDTLASRYLVKPGDILATNGLADANLVVGQVLVVPGAAGAPMPTPTPRPTPRATAPPVRVADARNGGGSGAAGGGAAASVKAPSTYSGGTFVWPVVGGNNYISQYFHYGHWAIDIAADLGSEVRAAGAGVVTYAGWKNNGGGYQVWIAHGSNLFTTYNHMSAVTVGVGQQVAQGQQVGRVGQTGNATGPHLHFEVWVGPIWAGGQRVNPLGYVSK